MKLIYSQIAVESKVKTRQQIGIALVPLGDADYIRTTEDSEGRSYFARLTRPYLLSPSQSAFLQGS